MASRAECGYRIKVEDEFIIFGNHYLPVQTAQSFWIFPNEENVGFQGPILQLTFDSFQRKRNFMTLQFRTETIEKAMELAQKLLIGKKAKWRAQFKSVKPTVTQEKEGFFGSIECEFWNSFVNAHFQKLILVRLPVELSFKTRYAPTSTFIYSAPYQTEEAALAWVHRIFEAMSTWSTGNLAERIKESADIRFHLKRPPLEKEYDTDPTQKDNPGYIATQKTLFQVQVQASGHTSEKRLFDARSIFEFVGEPEAPNS
ncbi:MAG: hypothetical protein K1X28_04615 [Parachlamydiales bacterium]|nr:hypothetical protein [Parachlamydiales bacterium]